MNKELILDNVLKSLDIMWKGMLSIFIVIVLIITATAIMNFCVKKARKKAENKKNQDNQEQNN